MNMFHLAQVNIGMAKSAMESGVMKVFSDNLNDLVNISVWQSVEVLKQFMFKTHHIDFLKRKKKWFEATTKQTYVLWFAPAGHYPSIQKAKDRLALLNAKAETSQAFTFKKVYQAQQ
jgi:hypothetical protein